MSGDIRVDTAFLADLESRYRRIAGALREEKQVPGELHRAPQVEAAYRDFQGRWDYTRGKFADAADGFADALHKVGDGFVDVDQKLATSLESERQ